jgi:hypothetical protein
MTTFAKVWKLSTVTTISTRFYVWQGKRWETSLCTWIPFSDTIVVTVSRSVSWAIVRSLQHDQHSKWLPKSSMIWPPWHHERCAIIRCDVLRQIWNVVKKWAEVKQNEGMIKWGNNHDPIARLAHGQRYASTTSKGTFVRSKIIFCSCSWSIKKDWIWGYCTIRSGNYCVKATDILTKTTQRN